MPKVVTTKNAKAIMDNVSMKLGSIDENEGEDDDDDGNSAKNRKRRRDNRGGGKKKPGIEVV